MNIRKYVILVIICLFSLSCFRATVKEKNPEKTLHYNIEYDYSDLHKFTEYLVSSLLSKPPIVNKSEAPVAVIYGIDNHTDEHIDMKAITDAIRTKLIQSHRVQFVNIERRDDIDIEGKYMYSGKVDPAKRIELGKQVGAEYMITGTMYSINKKQMRQVRLKKKELKWYKLTLELTNIETSLIEWTDEVEIVREASKPFIGW